MRLNVDKLVREEDAAECWPSRDMCALRFFLEPESAASRDVEDKKQANIVSPVHVSTSDLFEKQKELKRYCGTRSCADNFGCAAASPKERLFLVC